MLSRSSVIDRMYAVEGVVPNTKFCRYCHTKLALSTIGFQHHEAHCLANPTRQVIPTAHASRKRMRKRWTCPVCAAEIDYWWRKRHPCWKQDARARLGVIATDLGRTDTARTDDGYEAAD